MYEILDADRQFPLLFDSVGLRHESIKGLKFFYFQYY
jgi:hypothetical protein